MKLLVTIIGVILVLEGLPYAAFPQAMQRWLQQIQETPPRQLRIFGAVAVLFGLLICYLTQRTNLFP